MSTWRTERIVDSFQVVDDAGNKHTVVIHQLFVNSRLLSGQESAKPGIKRASLSNGHSLNVLDDEMTKFQVVVTGQILTRS